jgi:hypothetical protein
MWGHAAAPLLLLVIVLATDAWVYADAKRLARHGTPVRFSSPYVSIETPEGWLVGCLVLWVFFFPLYIAGRDRFA